MIYYVCKRRPSDGWGCANLYAGQIMVGQEHKVHYRNEDGEYCMLFYLPGIKPIYSDDQLTLRGRARRLCDEWFEETAWTPEQEAN